MRNPIRITIAFDKKTHEILKKIRERSMDSQSEIIRKSLRFYSMCHELDDYDTERIGTYIEMLWKGEHIILDFDHWIAFLRFIDTLPDKDRFLELHRKISRSHAEQFRDKTADQILSRLETCNFFRVHRNSERDFTLILGNELTREFIKIFLEEVFSGSGIRTEIMENLTKLRVKILSDSPKKE